MESNRQTKVLTCKNCGSDLEREFNGEIALHFSGLSGLDKPIVWVFPKVFVCLNCGSTEFQVPQNELEVLCIGDAA
jgi:transcription elongation factor Elf1